MLLDYVLLHLGQEGWFVETLDCQARVFLH